MIQQPNVYVELKVTTIRSHTLRYSSFFLLLGRERERRTKEGIMDTSMTHGKGTMMPMGTRSKEGNHHHHNTHLCRVHMPLKIHHHKFNDEHA